MFSFDTPINLVYGVATGLAFGFLLSRGGLTHYRVIVGQFLLKDNTVLKTMLTAVVVGSIGVIAMHQFGNVALHIKETAVAANLVGGLLFGFGMVLLGYCPGTGAAAIGDGSRDAIYGILGMIVGAAVYAEVYPLISGNLLAAGSFGKITFSDVTGLSPWLFVAALAVAAVGLFAGMHHLERKASQTPH